MKKMTHAEAIADALYIVMKENPRVALVWGSIMGLSGDKLLARVREEFAARIFDPPISEAGMSSIGVGAALEGVRPIIPFGTASFVFRAWDQVLHEAGLSRYMSNGANSVPITFHMQHGLRGGGSAQHSQSPQAMFWNCPGLEIVLPSSPADAKGLFLTAVRSDNPTVFIDHSKLMNREGDVPDGDQGIPFGVADIKRAGGDVTIVATSLQVVTALEAAEQLAADGIEAEVIDPRTLVPFDTETVLESVARTGRLVVVDECAPRCSVASEICATVAEQGFGNLKAPPRRVTRMEVPVPAAQVLEDFIGPSAERVAQAVREVVV